MLWQTKQNFAQKIRSALYRIRPELLTPQHQAWSNLGLWQENSSDYTQAARQLAQQMGQALNLSEDDYLLDVGCGYGASLAFWQQHFHVQKMAGLELQANCCQYIQQKIQQNEKSYSIDIFQQSLFDVKPITHQQRYDVVLSLDAAYHYALNDYLEAIQPWLAAKGKIGFHFLLKSEHWTLADSQQKQRLLAKLKWVKVNEMHLIDAIELRGKLTAQGYVDVVIQNLTQAVLQGFSDYIEQKSWTMQEKLQLGFIKIYLTARLCHDLAQSGLIDYVQVTARKNQ